MSESSKRLAQIAANLQIGKIRRHIFLCADQTEPHCTPRDVTIISWNYLTKRLADLGLLAGEHWPSIARRRTACGSVSMLPSPSSIRHRLRSRAIARVLLGSRSTESWLCESRAGLRLSRRAISSSTRCLHAAATPVTSTRLSVRTYGLSYCVLRRS